MMKIGKKCLLVYTALCALILTTALSLTASAGQELFLIEEWEAMAELERHIASDEFRKIMAIMDMAVEPPEISFHSVSSTFGFELVEKIREKVNSQ